jgi:hypothetical protein
VWHCLKGWYKAAYECTPTASPTLLTIQTAKCIALYGRVSPLGASIPIHVVKANILDNIPSYGELRVVVWELQNRRAAGAMGLQVEHIKVWLRDMVCKEEKESDVRLGG